MKVRPKNTLVPEGEQTISDKKEQKTFNNKQFLINF